MINVYFSLGSNIGDREANILEALNLMDEAFGVPRECLSDFIETEAWGFEAEKFINCAVMYRLPRSRQSVQDQALDILRKVKAVERALGRDELVEFAADGSRIYHSRTIDVDILFFGPHRIDLPQLQVPHPLIPEREFVLVPLAQIAKTSLKQAFPAIFKTK